jgi:hypothetical protein
MGALTCHDVIVYNIVHDVIKCFVARAQNLPSNLQNHQSHHDIFRRISCSAAPLLLAVSFVLTMAVLS